MNFNFMLKYLVSKLPKPSDVVNLCVTMHVHVGCDEINM